MENGIFLPDDRGEWRESPLSAPLSVIAGDSVRLSETEENTIEHVRNGVVIATRTFDGDGVPLAPSAFSGSQTMERVVWFRRDVMSPVSDTLQSVTRTGDTFYFNFPGVQRELTLAQVQALAASVMTQQLCQDLMIVRLAAVDPTFENVDQLNGSTITLAPDGQDMVIESFAV